jgi:hypothetical protein
MFSSSFGLNGIFRLGPNKFPQIMKKCENDGGYIGTYFGENSMAIAVLEQEQMEW